MISDQNLEAFFDVWLMLVVDVQWVVDGEMVSEWLRVLAVFG